MADIQNSGQVPQGNTVIIQNPSNGIGTAGFVLSLIALLLGWTPIVGWIIWFLGLFFSFLGVFKNPRGLAIAGLVISSIGLILLLALGAFIATLFSGAAKEDHSTYADFKEAYENHDTEYHVVGKCDKQKATEYNPAINTDEFTFYMIDTKGEERKVVLHKSKPQDFEHTEQIVVIGKMQNGEFDANDILMKCPSKYVDSKPN
jgi:cytochrome c-type biogenesis protein CcmE